MANSMVVCTSCGYHGRKRSMGCGQVVILLFLLLFGLIPGIIYAIYADSLNKRCPSCDQKAIIPEASPVAREILSRKPKDL